MRSSTGELTAEAPNRTAPDRRGPGRGAILHDEGGAEEATISIKLVIADVDGTLVTRAKALTARTCQAVDRLRAAGIRFTITSGRPPRGLKSLVGPLKLTAPVAAFNGGVYVRPDLTTVLVQHTIPTPVARAAIDYLLEAGLDVWVYQGADWFIRKPDAPRVARELANVGLAPTVVENLHRVLDAPIKIVGVSEDLSLVARCEAELGARLVGAASAARSQPYYLDVTHPAANKGMVVREASRLLRIPVEEIATVGDMFNDVPMLTAAGMGIAMGNATPDVQRLARHVTLSNEEEGFAHAVDAFILGEPPVARTALGLPPRARACLFGLEIDDETARYVRAARDAGLRTAVVPSSNEADRYLAAAEDIGVDSEQAAVFDDEIAGVEAGRAGHFCYVVGIDHRGGGGAELRRHGADVVVPELTALLAPAR